MSENKTSTDFDSVYLIFRRIIETAMTGKPGVRFDKLNTVDENGNLISEGANDGNK